MIKETMASIKKAEKQGEEIVNKANEDAEKNIKKANKNTIIIFKIYYLQKENNLHFAFILLLNFNYQQSNVICPEGVETEVMNSQKILASLVGGYRLYNFQD